MTANRNKFGVSERAFSAYVFIRGFHIEYSPNKKKQIWFCYTFYHFGTKRLIAVCSFCAILNISYQFILHFYPSNWGNLLGFGMLNEEQR